jgi:hypothetical protein
MDNGVYKVKMNKSYATIFLILAVTTALAPNIGAMPVSVKLKPNPCKVPWRDFVLCECLGTCAVSVSFEEIGQVTLENGQNIRVGSYTPPSQFNDTFLTAFIETGVNGVVAVVKPVVNTVYATATQIASYEFHNLWAQMQDILASWWVAFLAVVTIVAIGITLLLSRKFIYHRFVAWWVYRKVKRENNVRTTSTIRYDEHGPHLTYKNAKIYCEGVEMKPLVDAPVSIDLKESLVAASKIEKAERSPAFIGEVYVGDTVVGMFSRIMFNNKHAILTAYHVLESHVLSSINIGFKGGKLPLKPEWPMLAASHSTELDFAIIEVPPGYFSQLGMKVGKTRTNLTARTGVTLFGNKDGEIGMSIGLAAPISAWRLKYGASTLPSWSGTPLLDAKLRIIGVHTEAHPSRTYNIGTALPRHIFQTKESYAAEPAYEDVSDDDSDHEEDYDAFVYTEDKHYKYSTIEAGKYRMQSYEPKDNNQHTPKKSAWARVLDDMDERVVTIGYGSRKETITICPHCGLTQEHAKVCSRCSFRTLKATGDEVTAKVNELLNPVRQAFAAVIADDRLVNMALDAVVEKYRKKGMFVQLMNEIASTGKVNSDTLKQLPPKVSVEITPAAFEQVVAVPNIYPELNTPLNPRPCLTDPKTTTVLKPAKDGAKLILTEETYVFDQERSKEEGSVAFNQEVTKTTVNLRKRKNKKLIDPKPTQSSVVESSTPGVKPSTSGVKPTQLKETLNSYIQESGSTGVSMKPACTSAQTGPKPFIHGQKNSPQPGTPLSATQTIPKKELAEQNPQSCGNFSSNRTPNGLDCLNGLTGEQQQNLLLLLISHLAENKQ